jgi:hypothetical protein
MKQAGEDDPCKNHSKLCLGCIGRVNGYGQGEARHTAENINVWTRRSLPELAELVDRFQVSSGCRVGRLMCPTALK